MGPIVTMIVLMVITVLFIASLTRTTWSALGRSSAIATLIEQEVVRESLNRTRFDRIFDAITKKTEASSIDFDTLRDPFL